MPAASAGEAGKEAIAQTVAETTAKLEWLISPEGRRGGMYSVAG